MNANLRPMNLGEILDRTLQIYRAKFLLFLGIAAFPALVMMATNAAVNIWLTFNPLRGQPLIFHTSLSGLCWSALLFGVGSFLQLLFRPAYVRAVSQTISGVRISVRDSMTAILRRWKTMLAINLFEQFVFVVVPWSVILVAAPALGRYWAEKTATPITHLVFILTIGVAGIGYLWLGCSFALSFPTAVLEGTSWLKAVERSWRLSERNRGRVLFIWLIVVIAGRIADGVSRRSLYSLFRVFGSHWAYLHRFPIYLVYYSMAYTVVLLLIAPIYPIALTLFYYDQRIRLEGYDIERMMDAAGLNAPVTPPAEAVEGRA